MSYELAPEVETVAKALIEAHHRHLLEAKISYVFKDKAWKTGDSRIILGKAAKRNELDQLLSERREDFVMIVGKDKWEKMTEVEKRCLVDHELCHMGIAMSGDGSTKFIVRSHPIEEFPENLARFEYRRILLGDLIKNPPSPIINSPLRKITLSSEVETTEEAAEEV